MNIGLTLYALFQGYINDIYWYLKTIPQRINPVRITRGSPNANENVEQLLAVAHASKINQNVECPPPSQHLRLVLRNYYFTALRSCY